MAETRNTIKAIVQLKKKNEQLEERLNFLKMENFDYALKCNHLENILSNTEALVKDNPAKFVEASSNLCDIMQACKQFNAGQAKKRTMNHVENTPPAKSPRVSDAKGSKNKAHVVNPHMVNGTILYIPTINLTRVKDQDKDKLSNGNVSQSSGIMEESVGQTESTLEQEAGSSSGSPDLRTNSQLSCMDDIADSTAQSPSHSTVLSGTFQEVKIFLNQVSKDGVNAEPRGKQNSSRATRSKSSN